MQETVLATGQHTWVPVTQEVWIVDQPAWDETITDYIYESHNICRYCGQDFHGWSEEQIIAHSENEPDFVSYYSAIVEIPVTTTLHHDEIGHTETQTVGYVCGVCGAAQ